MRRIRQRNMDDSDGLPSATLSRTLCSDLNATKDSFDHQLKSNDYSSVAKSKSHNNLVSDPDQNDVLFPLSGMSHWPGNEFFCAQVCEFQEEFLATETRSKRLHVARQLIQNVRIGLNQENSTPARFLMRRRSSNEVAGTHFQWSVMGESSILLRIGKTFRGEIGNRRKPLLQRMRNRNIKASTNTRAACITQSLSPDDGDVEDSLDTSGKNRNELEGGHDPLAGIKALCAVYSTINHTPTSTLQDVESSSDESLHQSLATRSPTDVTPERQELPDTACATTRNVNDPYASKDDEVKLPKGVTVRPSGKWQAQTYFAGQSRYVGVYSSSCLAAHSYRVVQSQLKKHRRLMHDQCRDYSTCSKDEVSEVFNVARGMADVSVRRLETIIKEGNYFPHQTEVHLLAELETGTERN